MDRPRQLVVCCDGTNNTLTAGQEDTNVLLLYQHLRTHAPGAAVEQLLYYDPGVGCPDLAPPTDAIDWVQRNWERTSGLASGRGVYENIAQAYLFLMRNWRRNTDHIYLFGFSRGAFTVRCVAGMVNLFGIIHPEHEALVPTLIHIYFSRPEAAAGAMQKVVGEIHRKAAKPNIAATELGGRPEEVSVTRQGLADQVRALFTTADGKDAWVHWVGVWDTVESVGLPGPLSRSNPSSATLRGKHIRHVRHALALDEHRWAFQPRFYEEPGDIDERNQTLKQRWFPGVHCDVGGSYHRREAGLSNEALRWMIEEVAGDMGIEPMPPAAAMRKRHDPLYDTPWWALAGMVLRNPRPTIARGQTAIIPAHGDPGQPTPSVWDEPRRSWPVGFALVAGLICLVASGIASMPGPWWQDGVLPGLSRAVMAAVDFAGLQAASLLGPGHGFFADGRLPWDSPGQPAWAMFWDLGFIAAWGYLLARVSSRAYAWMAGTRTTTSTMPAWRWLGMAPMAAVCGDVAEDMLTWLALAWHGLGADVAGTLTLWLVAVAALVKFAGLLACVPLCVVRCVIVVVGSGSRRRRAAAS